MKFELKTENENYLNSFSVVFKNVLILALVIIFFDVALKLGVISRQYQINFICSSLSVEKSSSSFKKLARLSNLKSKKRILEFCMKFVN